MASIGSTPQLVVGVGLGAAASAAFAPALEIPKQKAWHDAPHKILDAALLARLVAQGGIDLSAAHDEAKSDGYDTDKLDAMIYLEQVAPGSGEALALWRLGLLGTPSDPSGDHLFQHALTKAGLDPRYAAAIVARKTAEPVGLGDIAYAVVRGYLPTNIPLPVAPPATSTNVKRFPQSKVLAEELAELIGYDKAALELMIARSGLSMAPGMAAQAFFRGILAEDDYQLAVAEGDLRTEWGDALKEVSRAIPTVGEAVEGHLRGWITEQEMHDQTARHGMSPEDTDLIYKVSGRPITFHEITTGTARGGVYPSAYEDIPQPYRKSMQESNIRPEWASLHYANRYSYPSAFVLRSIAQAGDLGDEAGIAQTLSEIAWPPTLIAKVAPKWAQAIDTTDPLVKKARSALETAVHKAYVKTGLSVAQVTPALDVLEVPADERPQLFTYWDAEKVLASDVPPPVA